jgi:Leucine-rich repeat (LRR) protein
MPLTYLDCNDTTVEDLTPLAGMSSLWRLKINNCPVRDLAPLRGVPLQWLECDRTKVTDLTPLEGHLSILSCKGMPTPDLTPLRKTLRGLTCDNPEQQAATLRRFEKLTTINGKPAAEFWKGLGGK